MLKTKTLGWPIPNWRVDLMRSKTRKRLFYHEMLAELAAKRRKKALDSGLWREPGREDLIRLSKGDRIVCLSDICGCVGQVTSVVKVKVHSNYDSHATYYWHRGHGQPFAYNRSSSGRVGLTRDSRILVRVPREEE